ncbi:unnamed protein product [Hyaloperonospora brassicae]|uniref:K Homology domain-containing protein n=1 Tax=Hyaloperonospora brassicae TaxID=162125 RepID=A0AAV0TXB0_HYABA|nr:unnamed protein product [Hyaloperonospora brassicae]
MQRPREALASYDVNDDTTPAMHHGHVSSGLRWNTTDHVAWIEQPPAAREVPRVAIKPEPTVDPAPGLTSVPKISTFCGPSHDLPLEASAPAFDPTEMAAFGFICGTYDTDLSSSTRDHSLLQHLEPHHVPLDVVRAHDVPLELQHGNSSSGKHWEPLPQVPVALLQPPTGSTDEAPDLLASLSCLTSDEYDDGELHGEFQHTVHLLIPSNATAALLARRGQPIQNIGQQAECTLFIRNADALPYKDDRLLCIQGTAKCISLAQRLVVAYIRAFRAKKGDPNYTDLVHGHAGVPLVAVTSSTRAMDVAVASKKKKKDEVKLTNPFVWMVQREDVGKMMGKQGSVLQSIRRDTGASIRIEDNVVPGTTERRVVLSGPVQSIAAAVEKIRSRSGGRAEVAASATNNRRGRYFAIPYHSAGCLIGPQGSTIKSVTERTGARLQAPSTEDLPLGSINRILHIQGTPKQIEHARRVISAKLRDYLATSTSPQAWSIGSTGAKGDRVTIKVLLPSRLCGFMLADRGKLIREISEKSGAHTHFLAARNGDGNRVCVFTGDMTCVLRAQRLVLQFMAGDAISSKRVGGPRRKRKRVQGGEEKSCDHDEVKEECVSKEEPCYVGDVREENGDGDETNAAPFSLPVQETHARQQPIRHPQRVYVNAKGELYTYDDDMMCRAHLHQPMRQRPVVICPCEAPRDDHARVGYDYNEYGHDERMLCDVPRPRCPTELTVVRLQPPGSHEDEYDDDCDEYVDVDDDAGAHEETIVGKQEQKRRPICSRLQNARQSTACSGRKVQMIVTMPSARQKRSKKSSTSSSRATNGGAVCVSDTCSKARPPSVPRDGKGCGGPNANRGRASGNKRRC